ncbi:type II toxin-antitoxin system RelE/ParE family toxin [Sphingobium sp. CR2-8]|uniref:type II toxin-antitoxin system RelE/ParE family toxin n=1 Tax=Sphingobium sp. CR2-8 TaxID=1306534 RepID=UPI002DBF4D72|nr:type II toxin-antitoxin system RelE/ParE family toxin [Sphingobium sp. CR2-8]MEC3912192.1 type II toxin-antitoxin system RelE/ParE family toxin [Sphingobium sp. CR2-8]
MQVIETLEFSDWLGSLRDVVARRAIVKRLTRLAATGHFGDTEPVGDGVSEMRFHMGPSYRVYYIVRDGAVILCGGDKDSQDRDISKAKRLAADL